MFEPGQLVNIRVAGEGLVARGIYVRPSEDKDMSAHWPAAHWLEITHVYNTLGISHDLLHVGLVREVDQEHMENASPLERLASAADDV